MSSREEENRFASTRGLRSVPFLVFTNMEVTNACAFYLSVILLAHRLPDALLKFLPSGKPLTPTQGEHDSQCKGVIYLPNEKLPRLGRRLIELAEINRQEVVETARDYSDSDHSSSEGEETEMCERTKRRELRKQYQTHLDRSKKLLLLDVLKTDGLHSSEIWSVAFKMMVVSRALLLEDKSRSVKEPTEISEDKEKPAAEVSKGPNLPKEDPPEHFDTNYPPQMFAPGQDDFDINFPAIQKSTPVPTGPAKPTLGPKMAEALDRHGHGRKKSHSEGHVRSALTDPTNTSDKELRRFDMSLELWRVIIADAVGANGILSKEQQLRVMRYASDWNSLEQEISVQGAAENQQIWKILETVGCFAYTSMP